MATHPALRQPQHLATRTLRTIDQLERAVRKRPMVVGGFIDEELVMMDPVGGVNEVDTPRLATFGKEAQAAAVDAVIALLAQREEIEVHPDRTVELSGPHAAIVELMGVTTSRVVLRGVKPDDDFMGVLDRIEDRDMALARVMDRVAGTQLAAAGRPADVAVWMLAMLEVTSIDDRRTHPAEPIVERFMTQEDAAEHWLSIESGADIVVLVTSDQPTAVTGTMTIASDARGVHLHRGFELSGGGQEHTVTTGDPIDLAAWLALLLGHP